MEYVILDLEWNGTYSRRLKGFINEIIEFGAVKVDEHLNIISTFSHLVRPQIGKKISGKIKTLTHITNEQLSSHGMHYLQVVSRFRKWMGDAVLVTWGTADILTLIENCKYFCGNGRIPFLRRYINLQSYCAGEVGEDGKLLGLSNLAERLGIDQDDIEHHRALDDSLLTLRCMRKLYDSRKLKSQIQVANKQFYDKITFKTIVVCDLSHPLIQRKDMLFNCDCCGRLAHRESDWVLKNKSYRASFLCRNCKNRFYGRVQFKLKYDGLTVRKNILPYEEVAAAPKKDERKKEKKKEINVVRVNKAPARNK